MRNALFILLFMQLSADAQKRLSPDNSSPKERVVRPDTVLLKKYKEKAVLHSYKLKSDLDSVKFYSSKVIELVNKTKSPKYLSGIYITLANAYKTHSKLDSAEYYASKGYIVSDKLNIHYNKALAGYLLATIYLDGKKQEKAIKQILLNLKFAKQHQISDLLHTNYYLLAILNNTVGFSDPLSGYFAEKAYAAHPDSNQIIAHYKRKNILQKIKKGESVDQDLNDLKVFFESQAKDSLNREFEFMIQIGIMLLALNKPEEALALILPMADIKNSETNGSEFHIYNLLTSTYLHLNDINKAKEWHTKALKGEKKTDVNYNYLFVLKNEALIKEKEGKYSEALKILREYQYWEDSLSAKRSELNYLQISTFDSMEDLERSNDLQKAYIAKEKKVKNLMIAIISLLILSITSIAFLFWKIKNHNKRINNQKLILEEQSQKLNESNQVKVKLFSLLSHELRSPVAELISILNVKDKNYDQQTYKNYLDNIHVKATNIYNTLDGLLTWSSSQIQLKPSPLLPLELKSIVGHWLNALDKKTEKKGISIINQVNQTEVLANENQTNVVIRNILDNAIKFTPKDGFIRVYSIEEEDFSGIAVRDSGEGILEKNLKTLLVDVPVSQSGTFGEKGTGVGLLICKELMEKQNGKINIYSDGESGTEVRILFPKTH